MLPSVTTQHNVYHYLLLAFADQMGSLANIPVTIPDTQLKKPFPMSLLFLPCWMIDFVAPFSFVYVLPNKNVEVRVDPNDEYLSTSPVSLGKDSVLW